METRASVKAREKTTLTITYLKVSLISLLSPIPNTLLQLLPNSNCFKQKVLNLVSRCYSWWSSEKFMANLFFLPGGKHTWLQRKCRTLILSNMRTESYIYAEANALRGWEGRFLLQTQTELPPHAALWKTWSLTPCEQPPTYFSHS